MKYITILESENNECPNVGTITLPVDIENKFKGAIESHFDATLISYSFVEEQIENLDDCINGAPIDVLVKLDCDGMDSEYRVELSETWLY
jgi:hypothetical protein